MFTIVGKMKDLKSTEPDCWAVYRDGVEEGSWVADFASREAAELFVSVRGGDSECVGDLLRYVVEPCVQESPEVGDYAILENDQGATFWLLHCYDAAGDWHWTESYDSREEVDEALARVKRTAIDEMQVEERRAFVAGISAAESTLRMIVFGCNKVGLATTEVLLERAMEDLEVASQLLNKVVQRAVDSGNEV